MHLAQQVWELLQIMKSALDEQSNSYRYTRNFTTKQTVTPRPVLTLMTMLDEGAYFFSVRFRRPNVLWTADDVHRQRRRDAYDVIELGISKHANVWRD